MCGLFVRLQDLIYHREVGIIVKYSSTQHEQHRQSRLGLTQDPEDSSYATELQPMSPGIYYQSEVGPGSSFPQSIRHSFLEDEVEEEQKLEFEAHPYEPRERGYSPSSGGLEQGSPQTTAFSKYIHPHHRNRYESEEEILHDSPIRREEDARQSNTFTLSGEMDQEDEVMQVIPKPIHFPPRELHAVLEPLRDEEAALSFREGHGVLSRHSNMLASSERVSASPVPDILSKQPYNVLQIEQCRQSHESTKPEGQTPGSTPNFSDSKDLENTTPQILDASPSDFVPFVPIRRPSVRNVNDPAASPSKISTAPRVRTGLDSTKRKGSVNISGQIPRTKVGDLGDFAVLVEPDDGGQYNVVGIQDLSRGAKRRGYTPTAGAKKQQNPRQMKQKPAQQPPTAIQPGRPSGGVKNVQKKAGGPSTPHNKKPNVYEMPLKMEQSALSNRSGGAESGSLSVTQVINNDERDLGTLREMQEQLRKRYIEYASELNSSFLKEIRQIQKPAPETVKILELFCGLVCVAQFASGQPDAWIKRPKSWGSIQAMLSSPAEVVEYCRVFKDICEHDKYDASKVSALQCMLEKVQFRNIPGPQKQQIHFLYAFTKCMSDYVRIMECRKSTAARQYASRGDEESAIHSDAGADYNWMHDIATLQSQPSRRNHGGEGTPAGRFSIRDSELMSETSTGSQQAKFSVKLSDRRVHEQQQTKIDQFVRDTKKRIKERQSDVIFAANNTPKPMFHKFKEAVRKPRVDTGLNKSMIEGDKPRHKTPTVNKTFCTRENTPQSGRLGSRKGSLGSVSGGKTKSMLAGKPKNRAVTPGGGGSYSQKHGSGSSVAKKSAAVEQAKFRKGTASRMWSSKVEKEQAKQEEGVLEPPKPAKSLNNSFVQTSASKNHGDRTPPAFRTPTHNKASQQSSSSRKKHNFSFQTYATAQPRSQQDPPTPEPQPQREDLGTEEKTVAAVEPASKRSAIRRSFTKQEEASFSRSKTPLKQGDDEESVVAPRRMKRSNSQYIPPTKRLINMKNKKLRNQLEAAEKEKNRQSLARIAMNTSHLGFSSPAKTLLTSFTPDSNTSMFSPSHSQAFRSEQYTTERFDKRIVEGAVPVSNILGPQINAIRRTESQQSIQSSPPEKDGVAMGLSPDQRRAHSPGRRSPVHGVDQMIEGMRRQSIKSTGSGGGVSSQFGGERKERTSKDMAMIESLISRRKMQREEDLREKNLANKEKFIQEAVLGQDAIVREEEETEKDEDSPTKSFLAGKPMRKKRSVSQLSSSEETPSPGTWAEKQLRKDQKRIEKAMSMLQARR